MKKISKIENLEHVYVYDFGQNASGVFQIALKGKSGDSIKIIPAELIDENGLANQRATGRSHFYTYILKGEGTEIWQPRFTYYGFRYLQVEGGIPTSEKQNNELPEILKLEMLHNRNSSPESGSFYTSF